MGCDVIKEELKALNIPDQILSAPQLAYPGCEAFLTSAIQKIKAKEGNAPLPNTVPAFLSAFFSVEYVRDNLIPKYYPSLRTSSSHWSHNCTTQFAMATIQAY